MFSVAACIVGYSTMRVVAIAAGIVCICAISEIIAAPPMITCCFVIAIVLERHGVGMITIGRDRDAM